MAEHHSRGLPSMVTRWELHFFWHRGRAVQKKTSEACRRSITRGITGTMG